MPIKCNESRHEFGGTWDSELVHSSIGRTPPGKLKAAISTAQLPQSSTSRRSPPLLRHLRSSSSSNPAECLQTLISILDHPVHVPLASAERLPQREFHGRRETPVEDS
ncbi:hypothetical protein LguiA_000369 [Lonicera macranthoides]